MNIFSVGDGEAYELTRNEYINRTHKKLPFYQDACFQTEKRQKRRYE
jgi:hypothetical protein